MRALACLLLLAFPAAAEVHGRVWSGDQPASRAVVLLDPLGGPAAARPKSTTARLDEVYQEAVGLTRMLREQLGALVRAQPVMPMQRNVLLFAGAGADERRARTAGRRADKRARGADAAPP